METLSVNFLIKDSPTAVTVVDTEMRIIVHSYIWLHQFAKGHSQIIGKSLYETVSDFPQKLKAIHQECLIKGKSDSNKGQKFTRPNGSTFWLKWKINPWKNEDGSIGGLIITHEDVTEEKRNAELLTKAKRVARIGGWEVDLVGHKVYWTAMTREIHEVSENYEPNLEEGINFYKEGESRETITHLVNEAIIHGTPWDIELQIVTAKGRELWVRAKGEAEMIDGTCKRLFGTFQDIDEKKRTALEYQKVSDRLAIATHAAKIGIWDYDIVGNKLVWDENMYPLYGIKKKDFPGVVEAWESSVHPEDKQRCQKELEQAIAGIKDFSTEFRIVWPNGMVRYIKAESVVHRDSQGNPLRMVGANWDITEEKEGESKLKDLLDITSEQNKNLLNFAHIVSHNLRSHSTNLSMLSGFLSQEEDLEERQNLLGMLANATESLNETVLHLNEVVQVKTNAMERMKSVNLFDTLTGVKQNLALLIKEYRAECHIKVPKDLEILAIPAYLDSIFLNFFTNSLKYSSPDRNPVITVVSAEKKEHTVISFSDNGQGIDLQRHGDKLFGMYKTFHKHKDAKGIGLFITKNQIEAMEGKITVESEVDKGTTFTVFFPKK